MTKVENMLDWNFHSKCLEHVLSRMYECERFDSLNFYAVEAMNILLKMKECKYSDLAERNLHEET